MSIYQKVIWILIGGVLLGVVIGSVIYALSGVGVLSFFGGSFFSVCFVNGVIGVYIKCPKCKRCPYMMRDTYAICQHCCCDLTILHDNKPNMKD